MNQLDALRMMVRHYPGGLAAIAQRLGKSPRTLEKELGNSPDHKLGVLDACAISSYCIEVNSPHCRSWAIAVASECGGFVQLDIRDPRQAANPRRGRRQGPCAVDAMHDASQLLTNVRNAREDGSISKNELRLIERDGQQLIDQTMQVMADAREMHLAGIPATQGDA